MKQNIMVKIARITEEPYRIFFPLGIIWGMVGVSHWFFYGLGWIPSYSMMLHSSIQTQAYLMCFVLGFLLTAIPKFASAPALKIKEFFIFLAFMILIPFFYLKGHWLLGRICFMSIILLLARFVVVRFSKKKKSNVEPPIEFIWIPLAFVHGLIGTGLSILASFNLGPREIATMGKLLVEQGFILSLVLGVGSFLGPRLMGSFSPLIKLGESQEKVLKLRKQKIITNLIFGCLLLSSFVLEAYEQKFLAFFLRASLISAVYLKTKALIVRPLVTDQFVWILWASFWMVFIGHWAVVLFPHFRAVLMHVVFLGGYSLMIFAVGTMVIFSHGGLSQKLKKPHWILTGISILITVALFFRVVSVFSSTFYFKLLASSSIAWLLAASLWLAYVLPVAMRFVSAEEFEACHEEAKQQVANLRAGKPPQ